MGDKYKVTFDVNLTEDDKHKLLFHLDEIIARMFDVFIENLEISKE